MLKDSINDLDRKWQKIGILSAIEGEVLRMWRDRIGLFKAVYDGRIVYIGMARERERGGIGKRICDFLRSSKSARSHPAGEKLYGNSARVEIWGLEIKKRSDILKLRAAFIKHYIPEWNCNK